MTIPSPDQERDSILRQLGTLRVDLDLHRRAGETLQMQKNRLVLRGFQLGLSKRQMAKALGVTAQAVRFVVRAAGIVAGDDPSEVEVKLPSPRKPYQEAVKLTPRPRPKKAKAN